jgi:hypothetical protein
MRSFRPALIALGLLAATAAPARADFTAFLGATTTPTNRQVRGASVGSGLLIVAFEFEYSSTTEDVTTGASPRSVAATASCDAGADAASSRM